MIKLLLTILIITIINTTEEEMENKLNEELNNMKIENDSESMEDFLNEIHSLNTSNDTNETFYNYFEGAENLTIYEKDRILSCIELSSMLSDYENEFIEGNLTQNNSFRRQGMKEVIIINMIKNCVENINETLVNLMYNNLTRIVNISGIDDSEIDYMRVNYSYFGHLDLYNLTQEIQIFIYQVNLVKEEYKKKWEVPESEEEKEKKRLKREKLKKEIMEMINNGTLNNSDTDDFDDEEMYDKSSMFRYDEHGNFVEVNMTEERLRKKKEREEKEKKNNNSNNNITKSEDANVDNKNEEEKNKENDNKNNDKKEGKEKEEKEKEKEEKYNEAILRSRKNMFDELIRRSSKIMPNLYQLFPIKEENGRKQRRSIKEDYELLLSSSGDEFLSVDSDNQTSQIVSNDESENNGHFIFENNIVIKKINKILSETKIPKFNIDDYEIESTLGEGSYGVIYKVKNIHNGKIYAMKKMIANDVEQIEKAHKEYEIVSICNHPNVMKIYSMNIKTLDITTYCLYILMEIAICDWDKEIKKHLNEGHYYKENELILILKQLVLALNFMQTEVKITHRDIKPQNILCFPKHIYKIADFGEAKQIDRITKSMVVNSLRGTELYMSPLLFNGLRNGQVDIKHNMFKSDVYSFGLSILYAAATSNKPLYETRKFVEMTSVKKYINKLLRNKYSNKFIDLLCTMIEIHEKKRPDFIELENIMKNWK